MHWSCESTYNSKELQFKHDKRIAWFNISHQFSIQKFIPFNHIPNRSSFEVPVHHIIQYPSNKSQKSVLFYAIGLNARIWHSFQTEKYWNFTSDHSITPQIHAKTTLRANIQVKICPKSKPHREMLCQTKWKCQLSDKMKWIRLQKKKIMTSIFFTLSFCSRRWSYKDIPLVMQNTFFLFGCPKKMWGTDGQIFVRFFCLKKLFWNSSPFNKKF